MNASDDIAKKQEIRLAPALPRYEHVGPTPAYRIVHEQTFSSDGTNTDRIEVEVFDKDASVEAAATAERFYEDERSR